MMSVASRCRRKCVIVSLSALHSGHVSCFLRPAVYDVANGYLCTRSLALITAFLTSVVLYRFRQTGCNESGVHCSMSKKDSVDILCASFCNFSNQNLLTLLKASLHWCLFGGCCRRLFAGDSWYCFSRERIWVAQLLLSSMASCRIMKSFMNTAGGQSGFASSTDLRRLRDHLCISASAGRVPLRRCIAGMAVDSGNFIKRRSISLRNSARSFTSTFVSIRVSRPCSSMGTDVNVKSTNGNLWTYIFESVSKVVLYISESEEFVSWSGTSHYGNGQAKVVPICPPDELFYSYQPLFALFLISELGTNE